MAKGRVILILTVAAMCAFLASYVVVRDTNATFSVGNVTSFTDSGQATGVNPGNVASFSAAGITKFLSNGNGWVGGNFGVGSSRTPLARLDVQNGDALFKRIKASNATALVTGDFALSAGWGSTAAVSSPVGTDQAFSITVTANGAGIAANPTVTLTFHDGTWTNSPMFVCKQAGGTGTLTTLSGENTATATTLPLTFNGTPVAASTYIIACVGMGR